MTPDMRLRIPKTKGVGQAYATIAVRKSILDNHADLLPLVSIKATVVCIPRGNNKVLLAVVCKSPGHAWKKADITELLSFRHE
jgi:hypothetical protein